MLAACSCTEIVNADISSKRTSPPGKDFQRFLGSPEIEYPTSKDTPPAQFSLSIGDLEYTDYSL